MISIYEERFEVQWTLPVSLVEHSVGVDGAGADGEDLAVGAGAVRVNVVQAGTLQQERDSYYCTVLNTKRDPNSEGKNWSSPSLDKSNRHRFAAFGTAAALTCTSTFFNIPHSPSCRILQS